MQSLACFDSGTYLAPISEYPLTIAHCSEIPHVLIEDPDIY